MCASPSTRVEIERPLAVADHVFLAHRLERGTRLPANHGIGSTRSGSSVRATRVKDHVLVELAVRLVRDDRRALRDIGPQAPRVVEVVVRIDDVADRLVRDEPRVSAITASERGSSSGASTTATKSRNSTATLWCDPPAMRQTPWPSCVDSTLTAGAVAARTLSGTVRRGTSTLPEQRSRGPPSSCARHSGADRPGASAAPSGTSRRRSPCSRSSGDRRPCRRARGSRSTSVCARRGCPALIVPLTRYLSSAVKETIVFVLALEHQRRGRGVVRFQCRLDEAVRRQPDIELPNLRGGRLRRRLGAVHVPAEVAAVRNRCGCSPCNGVPPPPCGG